jgi:hypothetical protein
LSRSSNYYFIIEEDKLVHISRYALSVRRPYEDHVEYIVDLDRIRGKRAVEVRVSNSGIFCDVDILPAEDLARDYRERRVESLPLSYLNNFQFAHLNYEEQEFLRSEWRRYYLPMISYLREALTKRVSIYRVLLPNLIRCQIVSQASYPLSYLIPYSATARRRSLEGLTKWIHQLWVTLTVMESLARNGRLREVNLDFGQSPYHAVASFTCKEGSCSLWYEFDMNPLTMCGGMLWYREASPVLKVFYARAGAIIRRRRLGRAPLRPDIAILVGGSDCNELARGFRVKAIIECKNWDYKYWMKDVDTQLIPYREVFQPDKLILASMKRIPRTVKQRIESYRIRVIDEVYPGGQGTHGLLHELEDI